MSVKYVRKQKNMSSYIVYDLEFIGDITKCETCRIWEIGAISWDSSHEFNAICYPFSSRANGKTFLYPPPVSANHTKLDYDWLRAHHAESKKKVLARFCAWLQGFVAKGSEVILISHNNHKTDKIILESECLRVGAELPPSLKFFDSLPLFRRMLPGLGKWTLEYVHKTIVGSSKAVDHRAMMDSCMLLECLKKVTTPDQITGAQYGVGELPLTICDGVGSSTETKLISKGITNLTALYSYVTSALNLTTVANDLDCTDEHAWRIVCSMLHLPFEKSYVVETISPLGGNKK